MKKIIATVLIAALIIGGTVLFWLQRENQAKAKMELYREQLCGNTYSGVDGRDVGHGKYAGFYKYKLHLAQDGSWTLDFQYTPSGDPLNQTKFQLSGEEWFVDRDGNQFKLVARGSDLDWQGWSAAKISMRMEIVDMEDGNPIYLRTKREGYSTLLLQKE